METGPSQDPLMRERARRRRARQVQRRRVVVVVGVLLLILIVVLVIVLSGGGKSTATTTTTAGTGGSTSTTVSATAETFTADLTGAAEVPAVSTAATGSVTLDYDPAADTLSFTVNISQLTNPSTARIYQGKAGATGTAVLTLFSGPTKTGVFSGELNQGSVKDSDLTGSLRGKTIADLIALISASNAYVSVGTTSHPNGAIRGQLK
jgi:CHRD domain